MANWINTFIHVKKKKKRTVPNAKTAYTKLLWKFPEGKE